jgi:hypothetical protein
MHQVLVLGAGKADVHAQPARRRAPVAGPKAGHPGYNHFNHGHGFWVRILGAGFHACTHAGLLTSTAAVKGSRLRTCRPVQDSDMAGIDGADNVGLDTWEGVGTITFGGLGPP